MKNLELTLHRRLCNADFTELPYMVNKARLIEKISYLVKEKKIQGIQDIRDESDRRGMRVFIKIKKGMSPELYNL